MKRLLSMVTVICLCCGMIIGCGETEADRESGTNEENSGPEYEVVYEDVMTSQNDDGVDVRYIAEVKNTGDETILFDSTGNSVDLEDNTGNILATTNHLYTRPSVIDPGESAYISESLLFSTENGKGIAAEHVGKAILHLDAIECEKVPVPKTEVSEMSISSSDAIVGRLQNNEEESLEIVHVIIPLKNADNTLCAVMLGQVENIGPEESKGFEAIDYAAGDFDIASAKLGDPIICGDTKMFGGSVIR